MLALLCVLVFFFNTNNAQSVKFGNSYLNLSKKSVEGFSIQVYSGKREEALNTKKQLASIMPNLESEVQFTEPIFRVKAGKYFNRMDAQQDFAQIKRYFPTAIIIPERLEFN